MRRAPFAASLATLALGLAAAAPARAESIFVYTLSQSFSPSHLDVLTGDTVVWRNTSVRTHNVKFDTEGFNSGRVPPRSGANHVFPVPGVYPYICTIHDGMAGVIGVYPLVLEGPTKRVRRGTSVAFHVRAPENAGEVRIEADSGAGFATVAVAGPATGGGGHQGHEEPGTVHANVVASETAVYRAAFAGGTSNELRVEVTDAPDITAALKRGRRPVVNVRANPPTPGARVVLQLKLRERFGWWPVARARLDKRSRAQFELRADQRGVPARVVLVAPDWATVLSESRVLKLRH